MPTYIESPLTASETRTKAFIQAPSEGEGVGSGIDSRRSIHCPVCRYDSEPKDKDKEFGQARGNTSHFKSKRYSLWKCSRCRTIRVLDEVDFEAIYAVYPLKKRTLDAFAKGSFASLLKRLRHSGLSKKHRILDFGCGNGIFVSYLRGLGYQHVDGYDPFEEGFQNKPPRAAYDFIICNDVIEHCDDPHELIGKCADSLAPEGTLYVGTSDSEDVDMQNLEPHLMRLHLPYHRVLFTEESLHFIAREAGFDVKASWRRSYMDTWRPFCNYRFLDEFNAAVDHEMDKAFEPSAAWAMLRKPSLWFYAFFGKLFPTANEPAVALKKCSNQESYPHGDPP